MKESRQLIIRAYEVARRSGKTEWKRMTIAVLKNRLLDITDRAFDESTYGASSFMDFVLGHEDMLSIDRSVFPPIVELEQSDLLAGSVTDETTPRYRIRPDLWQAAIDHSSGTRYVWDARTNVARASDDPEDTPVIDSIAPDIQLQIRNEFRSLAKRDNELDEAESKQVEEWIGEKLGVAHLPIRLKSSWIRFFRDKVRDHLFQWFRNSELSRPDDFISPIQSKESPISGETEELRKLVLSVVREMTQQELSVLALPAKAVLRVARGFRK